MILTRGSQVNKKLLSPLECLKSANRCLIKGTSLEWHVTLQPQKLLFLTKRQFNAVIITFNERKNSYFGNHTIK